MSTEIELPNIGEGVDEADIAEILVSVGDVIEANQTVMELETDKAVVELPCPQAGTVEKILVSRGDTVRVGSPVLVLSSDDGQEDSNEGGQAESKNEASSSEASTAESQEKSPSSQQEEPQSASSQSEDETAGQQAEAEIVDGNIEFELPPLGEGVDSADIAEILVSEGDVIEADTTVMELETDKAVVDLPCPHAGKIKKIQVSVGDSVKVGQPVLTIEATSKIGGQKSAAPKADQKADQKNAASEKQTQQTASKRKADEKSSESRKTDQKQAPATNGRSQQTTQAASESSNELPVPAAPSTRRLARQLGVDLRTVNGSGRGGRITHDDVQAFVREQLQRPGVPARVTADSSEMLSAGGIAPPPLPDFSKFGPIARERMNKLSRTAAENLTVSWQVIPHVTQHDRIDITDLEAARKKFAQGAGKNGPKVTMTAIVMKALTKCLQAYPKFNSSLDPETFEIVFKQYYHIGCAVDTPNGLLVPVVQDCDQKNILEIARELTELAGLARDRKLPVNAMKGATCTVTNLGGIGGVAFTPIVNYPEVCILGMCRGQQELRMVDGRVEERLILPLSLSYDHRVINGADAARFLVALGQLLADPFQLLAMV